MTCPHDKRVISDPTSCANTTIWYPILGPAQSNMVLLDLILCSRQEGDIRSDTQRQHSKVVPDTRPYSNLTDYTWSDALYLRQACDIWSDSLRQHNKMVPDTRPSSNPYIVVPDPIPCPQQEGDNRPDTLRQHNKVVPDPRPDTLNQREMEDTAMFIVTTGAMQSRVHRPFLKIPKTEATGLCHCSRMRAMYWWYWSTSCSCRRWIPLLHTRSTQNQWTILARSSLHRGAKPKGGNSLREK